MKYILILFSGLFLSCYPAVHKIENITFSTSGGMSRANSTLSIDSNGNAVRSYTTAMGVRGGPLKCTLDVRSYDQITSGLNALDFPNLKDDYTTNATDCTTYVLTITYDNGKIKTINDYCRQGPKGLIAIYEDLFVLESSQKWVNVNK